MNKREENFISMVRSVIGQLKRYDNDELVPAVYEILGELEQKFIEANKKNMLVINSSSGVTIEKLNARQNMISAVLKVSFAGKAFANVSGNVELASICSINKTKLRVLRDNEVSSRCKNVISELEKFKEELRDFGIDENEFERAWNLIDLFYEKLKEQYLYMSYKGGARMDLDLLLEKIRSILIDQLDPIMQIYKDSNPDIYNRYMATRVIKDLGIRHRVEEDLSDD